MRENASAGQIEICAEGDQVAGAEYGDALVCVRCRYDGELRKLFTTVEIVADESDLTPPPGRYTHDSLVPVGIASTDRALQAQVRAVGGRWDRKQRAWCIRYGEVVGTKLEKSIIHNPAKQDCRRSSCRSWRSERDKNLGALLAIYLPTCVNQVTAHMR